jgi:hypothetical protein
MQAPAGWPRPMTTAADPAPAHQTGATDMIVVLHLGCGMLNRKVHEDTITPRDTLSGTQGTLGLQTSQSRRKVPSTPLPSYSLTPCPWLSQRRIQRSVPPPVQNLLPHPQPTPSTTPSHTPHYLPCSNNLPPNLS